MRYRGIVLSFLLASPLLAADWPQFLGPNRDSVSPEKVAAWSGPLEVLWKQPLGDAHSSPVVADGLVYAFYQPRGKNADALAAYDAATGEKKWEYSYERPAFTPPFGAGPRGTPTVAHGAVYTLGSTGVLACWDAKTGEIRWTVDTLAKFQAKNLFFGISTSPTVVGDVVVVMVGGKGAGIVGFDTKTGETRWQTSDDPASYASPLPLDLNGSPALVFLTGSHVRAVSAEGKPLWQVPFRDRLNESSTTPVKAGELLVASSVTAGSLALKFASGMPETQWKNDKLTCYFSTPVPVGPNLYMINGAASLTNPSVTLRCVETATGKVLWTKEKVGRYHAALLRTAGDNLLMLDDTGYLTLFEADDSGYKELARSKVCGPTWAHPALSNDRLFLRDEKELIALKLAP